MATANQGVPGATLKSIVEAFNASQPQVTVQLQQYPDAATLLTKDLTQLAAGDPPTLSPCQPSWETKFVAAHALADLTPFIEAKDGLSRQSMADFNAVLLKYSQVDGRQYALPYDRSIYLLYYNEQLFKQAGIAQPPRTWSEFAADAGRLSTGSTWASDVYNSPQQEAVWDSMVQEYGGRILNRTQSMAAFDSKAAITATSLLADVVRKGYVHIGSDPLAGQLDFGSGHIAMYVADSSSLTFLRQLAGSRFTMNAAPLPAGPAGTFVELGAANICMFNKASLDVQHGGFLFIKYLLNTANAALFSQRTNYLPVRRSAIDHLRSYYAQNPLAFVPVNEMSHAVNPPSVLAWPQASAAILVEVMAAIQGTKSVREAIASAAEEVNAILKQAANK